jgi:hypothetical protein
MASYKMVSIESRKDYAHYDIVVYEFELSWNRFTLIACHVKNRLCM